LFYFTFILVLLQLCEPLQQTVLFYFYFSFIAVVRAALLKYKSGRYKSFADLWMQLIQRERQL